MKADEAKTALDMAAKESRDAQQKLIDLLKQKKMWSKIQAVLTGDADALKEIRKDDALSKTYDALQAARAVETVKAKEFDAWDQVSSHYANVKHPYRLFLSKHHASARNSRVGSKVAKYIEGRIVPKRVC